MKLRASSLCSLVLFVLLIACSEDRAVPAESVPDLPDFDAAWNYGAPGETREKFTVMLAEAGADAPLSWQLELKTQIARTHSLTGEFDDAHRILDNVEPEITDDMGRLRVRYLLERGRTFNSGGEKEKAKALFVEAFDVGKAAGEDNHTVDAAHMVAIAATDAGEANRWNHIGLEQARQSKDKSARGWVGSLTNNMGWTAFDTGKLDDAIALFEESRDHFLGRDLPARARIARWSIARVKREQGAIDEALAMQLEIRSENEAAGDPDGYCFEELGELYLLKGEKEEAAGHFAKAYALLSKDSWFAQNESKRLARIKELASE